jgi:topoisomerase-4 subunit A
MILIRKYDPDLIVSVVYFDGNSASYYLERFQFELSDKKVNFLNDHPETRLVHISYDHLPRLEIVFQEVKGRKRENEEINVAEFIAVKGVSAKGKRLSAYPVEEVRMLEPFPYEEPVTEEEDQSDENGPEEELPSEPGSQSEETADEQDDENIESPPFEVELPDIVTDDQETSSLNKINTEEDKKAKTRKNKPDEGNKPRQSEDDKQISLF